MNDNDDSDNNKVSKTNNDDIGDVALNIFDASEFDAFDGNLLANQNNVVEYYDNYFDDDEPIVGNHAINANSDSEKIFVKNDKDNGADTLYSDMFHSGSTTIATSPISQKNQYSSTCTKFNLTSADSGSSKSQVSSFDDAKESDFVKPSSSFRHRSGSLSHRHRPPRDIGDSSSSGSNVAECSSFFCYEQLGAPVLVYRNYGSYTIHDEKPVLRFGDLHDVKDFFLKRYKRGYFETKLNRMGVSHRPQEQSHDVSSRSVWKSVSDFITSTGSMNRTCAKYYYPMNYPYLRNPAIHYYQHIPSRFLLAKSAIKHAAEDEHTAFNKSDGYQRKRNSSTSIESAIMYDSSKTDPNNVSRGQHESTNGNGIAQKWYHDALVNENHSHNNKVDLQNQDLISKATAPQYNTEKKLNSDVSSDPEMSAQKSGIHEYPGTEVSARTVIEEINADQGFVPDFAYHQQQIHEKRAFMLYDSIPNRNQSRRQYKLEYQRVKFVKNDHRDLDSSYYVPAVKRQRRFRENATIGKRCEHTIRTRVVDQTSMYERERINRSDSSYLAPFLHNFDLLQAAIEDFNVCGINSVSARSNWNDVLESGVVDIAKQEVSSLSRDHFHSPTKYGNCLQLVKCGCLYCSRQHHEVEKTQCLLHPVGPLLECVKISFLGLPNSKRRLFRRRENDPDQLNVGDCIRQIARCGDPGVDLYSHMFVARTDLHCTIFQIQYIQPPERRRGKHVRGSRNNASVNDNYNDSNIDDCCGCLADLIQLYCIDIRKLPSSIARSIPSSSYVPIDVTCHPRYGNQANSVLWSDANIAIAYENQITKERNILHHITANEYTMRVTGKHIIRNIQSISCLNFTSHHPMVLWSASQSYVRPGLAGNILKKYPWVGHGSSLYSIDLRTNLGTFQWSPSHEEFLREGLHSISGIQTDWDRNYCVWVSSTSAGKTWELDCRMPCQVVTTWSLPHAGCDDCGSRLPPTGFYGAGTLFVKPHSCEGSLKKDRDVKKHDSHFRTRSSKQLPILSVGKSPDTYGIHMYYRAESGPKFQTTNVECVAIPGLQKTLGEKHKTCAMSSIFVLPDVSDEVFTCGLGAFRTQVNTFTRETSEWGFPNSGDVSGLLVILSMTSKGDLYSHTLAENISNEKKSKAFEDLPVGCSVIPIEDIRQKRQDARNLFWLSLSNTFPIPSRAFHNTHSLLDNNAQIAHYQPNLSQEQLSIMQSDDSSVISSFMVDATSFPHVAPNITAVCKHKRDLGSIIQVKNTLVVNQQNKVAATLESFGTVNVKQLDTSSPHTLGNRTDVTIDVLKEAWPDSDSDSFNNDLDSDASKETAPPAKGDFPWMHL